MDAILGADSLKKSVVAGLAGLSLVLLFMVLYYRAPGAVAALALVIYAALVLAIFKILPVTLTLSGVAAAILSHRHGGGRQYSDIRADERGAASGPHLTVSRQSRLQPGVAGNSRRQRVYSYNLRDPLLVRRHPRRHDRPRASP